VDDIYYVTYGRNETKHTVPFTSILSQISLSDVYQTLLYDSWPLEHLKVEIHIEPTGKIIYTRRPCLLHQAFPFDQSQVTKGRIGNALGMALTTAMSLSIDSRQDTSVQTPVITAHFDIRASLFLGHLSMHDALLQCPQVLPTG
jgi:hypothetical protein